MGHSDYPLQALLYAVVLHRFLRWRQPGYDPGRHLGGVLYLYLRGMCGPETPCVDGAAVRGVRVAAAGGAGDALSDLLDGRLRAVDDRAVRAGRRPRPPAGAGADRAARRLQPGGRADAADVHVARRGSATWPARPTSDVLLAVALAVRAVRHGSVCVDLATSRDVAPDLPWPDPAAWAAAVAALAARGRRRAAPGVRAGLPRPLPPARAPGRRRPPRPAPSAARRRSTSQPSAAALDRVRGDAPDAEQEAAAVAACPPVDDRAHRRARHRQDHDGRPDCWRCSPSQAASGRCPIALAAPTGKAAARLQEAVGEEMPDGVRRAASRRARRDDPAPAARLARPTTRPGSATTAATGSSTTWSWSTRPRWST